MCHHSCSFGDSFDFLIGLTRRQKEDSPKPVKQPKKPQNTSAADAEDGCPPAKKSKTSKAEVKTQLQKTASLTDGVNFSHECKTKDGWSPSLKRSGLSYIKDKNADIVCLKETKCAEADIPDNVSIEGYLDYWSSAEKAGYTGTGIYSKIKPVTIKYELGIDKHDSDGRVITAKYEKFFLVTAYVPNSGHGLPRLPYRTKQWDVDFRKFLNNLNNTKPMIMCGDLNVAHKEIDLSNPKSNKKTAGFKVEECQGCTDQLAEGYIDAFCERHPDKEGYTLSGHTWEMQEKRMWDVYLGLVTLIKMDLSFPGMLMPGISVQCKDIPVSRTDWNFSVAAL